MNLMMEDFKLQFLYRQIDFMKIVNNSVNEPVAVYNDKSASRNRYEGTGAIAEDSKDIKASLDRCRCDSRPDRGLSRNDTF